MGVTGIIEHYIAESQFTAVVLLKTEKECGIKIVKNSNRRFDNVSVKKMYI